MISLLLISGRFCRLIENLFGKCFLLCPPLCLLSFAEGVILWTSPPWKTSAASTLKVAVVEFEDYCAETKGEIPDQRRWGALSGMTFLRGSHESNRISQYH